MTQKITSKPFDVTRSIQIPMGIIFLQCVTFVLLYSVWILPEIAAWRNTSLVIGAVLGLYVTYQYRFLLLKKQALPIWLIGILFIWASFHLLFLSQNPVVQLIEFKGIWKRALLAVIFALGLGLSISNSTERIKKWAWPLIYLGLLMPTLIYLLKWTLTFHGQNIFGLESIPPYLKVYLWSQPFYVPKTDYVVFCLPTLAVALGQTLTLLQEKHIKWVQLFIYSASIAAVSFVFYGQNIRNGVMYAFLLFLIFLFLVLKKGFSHQRLFMWLISISLILISIFFISQHIKKNPSWLSLWPDIKASIKIEENRQWRAGVELPINENGRPVAVENYVRIAWAVVGIKLVAENPMGYGLIENSFAPMVEKRWPGEVSQNLSHAHSGWLDLALGLGLPGIALVLTALILALQLTRDLTTPWKNLGRWVLLSTLLLWCTTEVSNNGNFDPLLFWIVLTASLALRVNHKPND